MADARRAAILSEGERVLGGSGRFPTTLTLGGTTYIPEADRAAAQSYFDERRAAAARQTALRGGPPLRVPDARFGAMTFEDIAKDPEDYSSAADPRRPAAGLPLPEHPTYGLKTPEEDRDEDRGDDMSGKRKSRKNKTKKGKGKGKGKNKKLSNKSKSSKSRKGSRKNKH